MGRLAQAQAQVTVRLLTLFFFLSTLRCKKTAVASSAAGRGLGGHGLAGGEEARGSRRLAGAYAPPCVMGGSATAHKLKNLYSNTFNAIETTLPLHYPGR